MNIGDIEVVIAISKKTKTVSRKYNEKKLSIGLSDFRFDIAAYTCYSSEHPTRKFQKIGVTYPFILGIRNNNDS